MTLFKIISLLTGYVTVIVHGSSPERLINMASTRGIWLWNIKWVSRESIMASIRLSGIRPLRHIARETGCRFSIEDRFGLPFFLSKMRRRKTMVAGAVLFLVLLYMLSSFIWFVDVTGNTTVKDAEVIEAARQAGLAVGALKWNIDVSRVEEAIQDNLSRVSWAGVNIKGTRAIVEIVEKKMPPEGVGQGPSNIVAVKDGLVKELLVLKGHPVVQEGQTVNTGQVLISGEIPPPEVNEESDDNQEEESGIEPPEGGQPSYVRAQGIVRARVWYDGYAEVPLVETGTRPTGNEVFRVCLEIGDKEIILWGPEKISFEQYNRQVDTKKLPTWRNINIPVEINTERYLEIKSFRIQRTPTQARDMALKKAIEDAKKKIPGSAQIVNRRVEPVEAGERKENVARVKVVIETLESIGTEKPFKP
jgi:similar to stage IV sporulation protein